MKFLEVDKNKIDKKLLFSAFTIYLLLLFWVIVLKCFIPNAILGNDRLEYDCGIGLSMQKFMQ